MDVSALRIQLREAPIDFLHAVSSSTGSTLYEFKERWHTLCHDIERAVQSSSLNDEDMFLVHSITTLVATLGEKFLATHDEAVKRTTELMDDVNDIFGRLTVSEIDDVAQPFFGRRQRLRSASCISSLYIPAAYSWMLHNIHNPYPPNAMKERISQDAGRPLRVITDWFKAVRRHIGWVSMCKNQFKGSRALTIQAAKRVYLQAEVPSRLSSDIISQFDAIRTRLHNMYSMVDDNGDISDGTDDSFTPSSSSFSGIPSNQSLYARSRSSSSTPSLVFSTDDDDNRSLASSVLEDAPAILGKRKNPEEIESRSIKRNRYGFLSLADGLVKDVTSAPGVFASSTSVAFPDTQQPAPSRKRRLSVAAAEWVDTSIIPSSPSNRDPSPFLRTSKRHLSVSDSQPTPKRPCLPPAAGSRKQAVSTPIPIAYQATPDVDDWFRTFEFSETPLSVQLFPDWDIAAEIDSYPYNSLSEGILPLDDQGPVDTTPLSDLYQLPASIELDESLVMDPSVLNVSTAFADSPLFADTPPTHLTTSLSTSSPPPITATASSEVFDFLDAFLSTVKAESAEPQSTQATSSLSTDLSLDDSIELFGDLENS